MEGIHTLDELVFHAINGRAGTSELLDRAVHTIADSYLMKGMPVMALWWALWFHRGATRERVRSGLVAILVIALLAIAVGRALNAFLPFRLRPMHDPDLGAVLPIGAWVGSLDGWSSMPSDHAVLFVAMAVGMYFVHRWVGTIVIAHALVIVGLPRIFMGYHYPSDIVVGSLVGAAVAVLGMRWMTALVSRTRFTMWVREAGHIVYPLMFVMTFQIASMFDSARDAMGALVRLGARLISP